MKIYDISQELFTCVVYPGDLPPSKEQVLQIKNGDECNLTNISICAHNGTHIDVPYHFLEEGKTVEQIDLDSVIGEALVVNAEGDILTGDIDRIMEHAPKRILFKGNVTVTPEAAKAINRHGVLLVGVESQTIGKEDRTKEIHLELLSKGVILLEGIRLKSVPEGWYLLNAAPINLGGADGAPCRAVLISFH